TFSKAFGLAGARVGYGVASTPEIATAIRKVRPNFSLNIMALAGACAAMGAREHAEDLVRFILDERDRIAAKLSAMGYRCLAGAANFVTVLPPLPAA
ncbi:aminotransferase class I/II-fold pyridoxal phosphate-dependent enzyme, partial [Pseudoalteromonas sp. SYSU M81241]